MTMSVRYNSAIIRQYSRLIVIGVIALIVGGTISIHYLLLPRYNKVITQTKSISFQTTTSDECSLPTGTDQVATKGVNGVETIKINVYYVNNKKVSQKVISDKTTTQPVTEVVNHGINDPNNTNLTPSGTPTNPCASYNAVACDLDSLILPGAGGTITIQQYDTYVQQAKKDNCGTPKTYCSFNLLACSSGTNSYASSSSGYDAGYSYAEQNQICDTSYSDGNSDAFNQGVQDWAAANCTDGQPN